jgi:hypothetical protein
MLGFALSNQQTPAFQASLRAAGPARRSYRVAVADASQTTLASLLARVAPFPKARAARKMRAQAALRLLDIHNLDVWI